MRVRSQSRKKIVKNFKRTYQKKNLTKRTKSFFTMILFFNIATCSILKRKKAKFFLHYLLVQFFVQQYFTPLKLLDINFLNLLFLLLVQNEISKIKKKSKTTVILLRWICLLSNQNHQGLRFNLLSI